MNLIKRSDPRYIVWKKRQDLKNLKKRTVKRYGKKPKQIEFEIMNKGCLSEFLAPERLSFLENFEDTAIFFADILNKCQKRQKNQKIFIDLKRVNLLTIDAVMYLIAIIINIKKIKTFKKIITGNEPKNRFAAKLLRESGFYKYVSTVDDNFGTPDNPKLLQIRVGDNNNPLILKEICDFVNSSCGTNKLFTKPLIPVISELMSNTTQHAYTDQKCPWVRNWYIFIENSEDKLSFVFLDTGEGIPQTIRIKFLEYIIPKTDCNYIFSALKGEYRSSTGKGHRGNGLPKVYEKCTDSYISNFRVISGKGNCFFKLDQEPVLSNMNNSIYGTLFFWEINKNNIGKEYLR